ncbi:helix-turn-helix domain-containing protein [Aquimarina litoralis]|uniref:helix-turn-helix domain-containing protein n=1 Tax=Aquimarina litoralis TaxID=584605 RepID=UPI001C5703A4|nr:AraC family transcriptional regulator [Aquimarina litoralis]MBW1295744.1 helix-turn-helix domain-containing protein [Aquimarina litoralis]
MKKLTFLFFIFLSSIILAQETNFDQKFLDSIQSLKYFELYQSFIKYKDQEPLKAHIYADAYLKKAKNEENTYFIAHGWILLAEYYKETSVYLTYTDSIIQLTEKNYSKEFPARAYILKGEYFYRKQLFAKALRNYGLANQVAMQKTNPRMIYESNRAVGVLNSDLGFHEHALKLFKDSYVYAENEELASSLIDLDLVSKEFINLQILDSAMYYNDKGIKETFNIDKKDLYHSFVINSGIILYHGKEYKLAIDSLLKGVSYIEKNDLKLDLVNAYYYLGKSYDQINNASKSIACLEKTDSLLKISRKVKPAIFDTYKILMNQYQKKENPIKTKFYADRLSELDSIAKQVYTDSVKSVIASYKTPKIVSDDDERISDLVDYKLKYVILIIGTVVGFALLIGLLVYVYKDRNQYKKSFNAVVAYNNTLSEESKKTIENEEGTKVKELNISKETIDAILKGITTFENNKKYLNKKYSLSLLAKEINTNSTYLSKVINIYMGKSFSNYLHDLRIGYAIDRLRDDRQFRLYSIKGISEEVGFKNSESFSKAFHKKTGIYPSAFIKKLKNA